MTRAILFDCFGVLATGTWCAFLDTVPPSVDRTALHDLNRAHDAGIISHTEFDKQIVALTGAHPKDIESVGVADVHKNHRLINHIRESLRPQYRVGILSNIASDWVTRTLLDEQEQALFDVMVFSYQVGVAKPDPEIFHVACQRLDLPPAEILFIDDVPNNVSAAQSVGMQAAVYTDFHTYHQLITSL